LSNKIQCISLQIVRWKILVYHGNFCTKPIKKHKLRCLWQSGKAEAATLSDVSILLKSNLLISSLFFAFGDGLKCLCEISRKKNGRLSALINLSNGILNVAGQPILLSELLEKFTFSSFTYPSRD
jgi:hypothetical protein